MQRRSSTSRFFGKASSTERPAPWLPFIDDSASDTGDRRLFLAGYLNRTDRWALFSEAWREELKAAPSIAYLKMSEANAFVGQFTGWTTDDRDEKLRGLIRVIKHFEPMSFEFSVSREEYYREVKPAAPRGIGNPHFACCLQVVFGLAQYVDSEKVTVPMPRRQYPARAANP
jgi:hypothetical protein